MKDRKYRVIVWNRIKEIKDMKNKVNTLEKGLPIEGYQKILKVIMSITSNVTSDRVDNQFRVVDKLIERFRILYKDQIDTEKLGDFLTVSKKLRHTQVRRLSHRR